MGYGADRRDAGNENTRGDNYITWVANGRPSWTMHAESIGPDPEADIGQRLVSEEPMYLILNFGTFGDPRTVARWLTDVCRSFQQFPVGDVQPAE